MSRRLADEDGFVAGGESLAFGVLIFVLGTLLIVNLWAVVDARFATSAAAREAVRAATATDAEAGEGAALDAARQAAGVALAGHGIDPARAEVAPIGALRLERCAEVTMRVTLTVPALVLPGIERRVAAFEVVGEHREVIEPYRSGLAGEVDCGY